MGVNGGPYAQCHADDIFRRHGRGMSSNLDLSTPPACPSGRSHDIMWFRWMGAGQTDCPRRLRCAIVIAHWSWLPLAAVLGASMVFRAGAAGPVLQAVVVATLLQVLVKRFAKKLSSQRPFSLGLCANHLHHSNRGGMPSTHAAVMACLAGALSPWMTIWPETTLLPCIALITGWARVHAGAHFPSDVLAGLLLGVSVGRVASQTLGWA